MKIPKIGDEVYIVNNKLNQSGEIKIEKQKIREIHILNNEIIRICINNNGYSYLEDSAFLSKQKAIKEAKQLIKKYIVDNKNYIKNEISILQNQLKEIEQKIIFEIEE